MGKVYNVVTTLPRRIFTDPNVVLGEAVPGRSIVFICEEVLKEDEGDESEDV